MVIDSVAALVPRAEIEGEMGDSHVGLQARLMSQALRKMAGALSNTNTTCIFINQLREKIGVMFGSPETTTGGKALKFYASVRLDVRRIETLKGGTEAVGNRTRVKVVKNKVAPPFKQAEFDILYGEGISREGSLIDIGVDAGIVRKSGAWYTYEGDQLGQGKENARTFLKDNPDLANEIEKRIKEALHIGPQVDAPAGRARRGQSRRPRRSSPSTDVAPITRTVALTDALRDRAHARIHGRDLQPDADPEQVARTIVLRRLSVSPRTRKELADDLRKRGIPDDVADRVLGRFAEVGLIDDAEYARMWVDSRQRTKGSARSVLRQELRARGSATTTLSAALEAIDDDMERARAVALVHGEAALRWRAWRPQVTQRAAGEHAHASGLPARLACRSSTRHCEASSRATPQVTTQRREADATTAVDDVGVASR